MTNVTFGDNGLESSDAAWAWLTAQRWTQCYVDVIRGGNRMDDPALPERSAPRQCEIARLRMVDSPLEPSAALRSHSGTDFMVVGARSRRAVRPASLGSTVEALMQHPPVSLIVAREGGPVRTVLICVPGNRPWPAVHTVVRLPWIERAMVDVLCVLSSDDDSSHAHDVLRALTDHGVRARLHVRRPDATAIGAHPKYRIFDEINRMRPDLVIVGAPKASRVTTVITGSTSAEIARYADCSVMLACPPTP